MALTGAEIEGIQNNLIFAIQNKLLCRIYYRGDANVKAGYRIIEPYVIGYGATGEQYVRAYAVDGVSKSGEMPGWKLLLFYRIRKANVRFQKFNPRPEYVRNDSFITARFATVLQKFVNKEIRMETNEPIYQCIMNPDDKETGVNLVSIVDEPAIERYFVAMQSQKVQRTNVHLSTDEKRIVTGPVIIPNKLIFRKDESGKEFYIYFTEQTILECAKKYFRLNSQNQSNVNHENNEQTTAVTAFESWIITDKDNDKANALGMDLPVGTWMLSYHVKDDNVWQKIKSGELKGFSLEGYFDYVGTKVPKEVNNKKQIDMNKIMLQANELLSKITKLFEEEKMEETGEWMLQDGTAIMYNPETAAVTNQDGTPLADGEYILSDNSTIVVSGGLLVERKEAVVEEAPAEEAPLEEVAQGNVAATVVNTADGTPIFIDEQNNKVYTVDAEGNATQTLVEDGEYTLEDGSVIMVEGGVMVMITPAEMKKQYEEKMQELMVQLETVQSKYEKLKNKQKETEEKLTAVSTEFETFKNSFGGEKPSFTAPDSFSFAGKKADNMQRAAETMAKYLNKKK
jgi:hypothetical protein